MFGKFKPIKIEGKDLREEIDNIRDKKRGFKLLLLDLAEARCSVDKQVNVWFDKVFKKYNIPKRYRNELTYIHSTHELKLKD